MMSGLIAACEHPAGVRSFPLCTGGIAPLNPGYVLSSLRDEKSFFLEIVLRFRLFKCL
jgi:hypothetical protein